MYTACKKRIETALAMFVFLVAVGHATRSFAQTYQLTVVAEQDDVIEGRTLTRVPFSSAQLNDRGTITFVAGFTNPDGSLGAGIFTPDQLLVETGQTLHGRTLTILGDGILNDNNDDIVFSARFSGGSGVFTLAELVAETGQLVDGKEILGFLSTPVQNDVGEVLMHATTARTVPNRSILFTRAGILAETGVPIEGRAPVNIISGVDLNNAGDVIFVDVELFPSTSRAIMTPNEVLIETGDVIDGHIITEVRNPSLNNNREVVFMGGAGIFVYDIAAGSGEFLFELGDSVDGKEIAIGAWPYLNDQSELAFFAVLRGPARREALVASDTIVVKTGDVIGGKVVSSLGPFYTYNDRDELSFIARFTDASRAVVFATRDSDGDGIPDDEDACDDSDLGDSVVLDSCDSGVTNELFADGCTLADIVSEIVAICTASAKNQGQAVSCVSHETNELKKAGIITGDDKGAIQSCLP